MFNIFEKEKEDISVQAKVRMLISRLLIMPATPLADVRRRKRKGVTATVVLRG
jgi:hypothetical protein